MPGVIKEIETISFWLVLSENVKELTVVYGVGVESGEAGDSLGSSSESELRVTSARGSGRPVRPSAAPARASALSDNEF